jgi:hypothetical protein
MKKIGWLVLVVGLVVPVYAQDKTQEAKDALTKAQAAVQGAQRAMLATPEGQRYQEALAVLRAIETLIAPSKVTAPKP